MSGAPLGLPVGTGSTTPGAGAAVGANASSGVASSKGQAQSGGQAAGQGGGPSGFEAYLASDAAKPGSGRGERAKDDDKLRQQAALAASVLPAFVPMPHDFSAMNAAAQGGASAESGATPGATASPGQGSGFDLGAFASAQVLASAAQGAAPPADSVSADAGDDGASALAAQAGALDALAAQAGALGAPGAETGASAAGATGAPASAAAAVLSAFEAPPVPPPGATTAAAPWGAPVTHVAASPRDASFDRSPPNAASPPSAPAAQPGAAPAGGAAAASAQTAAALAGAAASSAAGASGLTPEQAPAAPTNASAAHGVRGSHAGAAAPRDGVRTSGAGANVATGSHAARPRGSAGGGAPEGDSGSEGSSGDAQSFTKGDVSPDGTTLAGLAPATSADPGVKPLATVTDSTATMLQGHVTGDRLRDALASVQNHAVLRSAASGEIDVPELGRVAVRAHTVGGAVDVDITADRADARAALHQHSGAMTADLREADVRVGRMTIDAPHGAGKAGESPLSDGSSAMSSNRQNDGSSRDASQDADDTTPHDPEPQAQPAGRVRIVL